MSRIPRLARSLPLLCLALLSVLLIAWPPAATASPPQAVDFTFSGHVYTGVAAPIGVANVTITLYGANARLAPVQLDVDVTERDGSYSLSTATTTYECYRIVETVPANYVADGATPGDASGAMYSVTRIDFCPPRGADHPDNNFHVSAVPTPVPTSTSTFTPIPTATSTPTRTLTPTPTRTRTPTITLTPQNLQTIQLCASADTTVSEQAPSSNYGDETLLVVGYYQGTPVQPRRRMFVRFTWPTLPPDVTVYSASLQMRLNGASGDATRTVYLYAPLASWDEMTVTWDNQPGVPHGAAAAQAAVGSAYPATVSWNVTTVVQEWFAGTRANNGLELRGDESGGWLRGFDSRETAGGFCPTLVIEYTSHGQFATLTPSATPTPTHTPTRTPTPTATVYCFPEFLVGSNFENAADFVHLNKGTFFEEFICPAGDEDWWKFHAEAGQFITAQMLDLPNNYWLALYRPDGAWFADSFFSEYNEEIAIEANMTGDWRLVVKGVQPTSYSSTQRYRLAAGVCATEDESTPASPKNLALEAVDSGYICPCGDADWFAVSVPDAQALTVHAWLGNPSGAYDLYVYSPDGVLRRSNTELGEINKNALAVASNTPGVWKIRVGPHSDTDCSASQPYQVQVVLETDLDLTVKWIEVTQATQEYLSNSVDMVLGKPTLARVYVGTGDALGPIEDVAVELWGYADCLGCTPLPGSPLDLGTRTVTKMHTQNQRLSADGFQVFLPASWQQAGNLYLRARVYTLNPAQIETHTSNNIGEELAFFVARGYVDVAIVPVTAAGVTPPYLNNPALDTLVAYMRDVYPIKGVQLWLPASGQGLAADYDYTNKQIPGCGTGWGQLLADLALYYKTIKGPPAGFLMYGILDPSVPHHFGGCGSYTQRVAAGILAGDDILAHEAGHMLGLPHAPCGDPQGPEIGFPIYVNPLGGNYPSASIGEVGVRLSGGVQVFDPASAKDFMSYCGPEWISPHNYDKLMGGSGAAPAAFAVSAAPEPQERQVIAIGQAYQGNIELSGALWLREMAASAAHAGEGPYRIEVQDAAGVALSSRNFVPDDPNSGSADEGFFHEKLPYPASAARVVFKHDGAELRVITPSAHAPTVTVTYPNGGEVWAASGTYTVTWQAGDADGDALRCNLLYSRDGGATWNPTAVNLTTRQYAVDAAWLAGSAQALFRVEVSDGLNTVADQSNAPFSAPQKAPLVWIVGIEDGAAVDVGEQIVLQGLATDLEDGPLDAAGFVWSSDRDGSLGTGDGLIVSDLSPGWHTLTLAARDSAGAWGYATARVRVGGSGGSGLSLPLILRGG